MNIIIYLKNNKIITPVKVVILSVGIISLILWRLSMLFVPLADILSATVSFAVRWTLAAFTRLIPISLGEAALFASVPALIVLIVYAVHKLIKQKGSRTALPLKMLSMFLCFVCFVTFLFVFTLGVGYGKSTIEETYSIEKRPLSLEELSSAMEVLINEVNKLVPDITRYDPLTGSTQLPYDFNELVLQLNVSYKSHLKLSGSYPFIYVRVKPVILSELLSYLNTTGVYSFFTGEANLNMFFPDYTLPFTAAHEMAHLHGIAREDEANFTAMLVCLNSSDPYIRYSGMVSIIEYLGGKIYKISPETYYSLIYTCDSLVLKDMVACSDYSRKYQNTTISKAANNAYNKYLEVQGQSEGIESYAMVTDLAAVYILDIWRNEISRE